MKINNQLIPDRITFGEARALRLKIKKECKTIRDWKLTVKEFATENGLTDQEAIAVVNYDEGNQ